MSKSIKNIIFLTVATLVLAIPFLALASSGVTAGTPTLAGLQSVFGAGNLTQIIARILQLFFALLGVIALVILLYAGFIWMTSQGDPGKIEKAKNMIYGAVIGLIIIFSAYAVASLIFNYFRPQTTTCTTPGEQQDCSVAYCNSTRTGYRECSAGKVWSSCHYDTSCGDDSIDFYSQAFANIFKFSDSASFPNWPGVAWDYSRNRSKLVALPRSATLQVEAYAHITGVNSKIDNLHLWETSSTERDLAAFTITGAGARGTYNFAWASTTWGTKDFAYDTTAIKVRINENNSLESKPVKVLFCADHYFDGLKNYDETGIDCGPGCLNCAGEACKKPGSDVCSADNCASGICNTDCRCASAPEITYVDPALDVNNDTNRLNLVASQIDDDISNGAVNNYVTIFGRNFGSATGTVKFSPLAGNLQVPAVVACAKSWSNNQIVVLIPSTLVPNESITTDSAIAAATPVRNYTINVQPAASTLFSNAWGFQVNKIERPGICQMTPGSGAYPTITTANGSNFPTTGVQSVIWSISGEFSTTSAAGRVTWYSAPFNVTSTAATNWTAASVKDVVPQNRLGRSGVRVYNGNVYSNYYVFQISDGKVGSPCGYDSQVCDQDLDTCGDSAVTGLQCQNCQRGDFSCDSSKNCTCQPLVAPTCTSDQACSSGGCSGTQQCLQGKLQPCVTVPGCVGFLGKSSTNSLFSWAFLANKQIGPGKQCLSELWNDETCSLSGCLDSNLACDTESSTDEFVELYNPTGVASDLSGLGVVYGESPVVTDGLLGYYQFNNSLKNSAPGSVDSLMVVNGGNLSNNIDCINLGCVNSRGARFMVAESKVNSSTLANFTWSVWFKPENLDNAAQFTDLLTKIGSNASQYIQLFWLNSTQELGFKWTNSFRLAKAGNARNKWHQVAVTFDDASNLATLYIDGEEIGKRTVAASISDNKYADLNIKLGSTSLTNQASFDDILIYDRVLNLAEIKNIYTYRGRSLSGNLAAGTVLSLRGTATTPLGLPKTSGFVSLVSSTGQVIDGFNYGLNSNQVVPGYYPGSVGRKNDGLDTDANSDFIYFSKNSEEALNTPKAVKTNTHLVINEFALTHNPCTCVQKAQMCSLGQVDNTACAPASQCQQVKRCQANGRFGSCELAKANCVPYLPTSSTIAVYAWSFNTNPAPPSKGPFIVSGCQGNGSCNDNNVLPSPTPWNVKWNQLAQPELKIDNASSCLNAVISARFSESMDANSLNTDNIKIFKATGANWEEVTGALVGSIDKLTTGEAGVNYFKITPRDRLAADSKYLVFVSKKVSDELGRNLIDNPSGVNSSYCTSTGSGLPTTPGVCWQFSTRSAGSSNLLCPVGCISVSPKNYFNRYYLQDKLHEATPISADNVCLALNKQDYAWNWSEYEQSGGATARQWTLQTVVENGFAQMKDYFTNVFSAGIFHQNAGQWYSGQATTTALRETNFRPYDINSWFSYEDIGYFRVTAKEVASEHFGSAPVHNDFTDPVVVENQYCSRSEDPAKQILQSPSPWKNQQDACINAVVFALFSRNMKNSSLVDATTGKPVNVEVYNCGNNAGKATSTDYNSGCTKVSDNNGWTASIFNYTQKNLTLQQLVAAQSTDNSTKLEGLRIFPKGNLEKNSWYRVVIKGGLNGVRGGTAGTEIAEGILQIPSKNALMKTGSDNSYYWYFKTGSGICPIDQVAVLPQFNYMDRVGLTQEYEADPIATNCNHLNPFNYSWNWQSLLNPFDDRCIDPATGNGVATICALTSVNCTNSDTKIRQPFVKAFGQTEGETNITARVETSTANETCVTDKWGYSQLQIGLGAFAVSSLNNSDCLNAELSLNFSTAASSTTLHPASASNTNGNILLYRCGTGVAGCDNLTTANLVDLTLKYPTNWPAPMKQIVFEPMTHLLANNTYRMVIKGGTNGVMSANNTQLEHLNYNIGGAAGGEACDRSTEPNNPLLASVCSDTCIFRPTANLCNTKYQECNNKQGLLAYYNFDNNYSNQVNIGIVSTSSTSFVAGKFNQALHFGAASHSYASLPSNWINANQGTISFWARPLDLVGTQGLLYTTNNTNKLVINAVNNTSTNSRNFTVFYGTDSRNVQLVSAVSNISNKWSQLVLTYNQNQLQLYVDGQLAATAANTTALSGGFGAIYLGKNNTGQFFDGDLDELATYESVLTVSEIKSLATRGYPESTAYRCNSLCQKMGIPTASNYPSGSCSNGKIDAGEQCDDGNSNNNDLCNNKCLWNGVSGGTCGNKVVDNGQFDSYYWDFKLSATAKVCNTLDWSGLNPCPNGIWSVGADQGVTGLALTAYRGSSAKENDLCIKDEELQKIGFWHRIINYIVKIAKSFLGLKVVSAAAYWCPINHLNFGTSELQAMARGNYSSSTQFADGATAELVAYTDDTNNFKINIIRSADWAASTEYKFIASYNKNGIIGTSTANITTFNNANSCQLKNIRFDVWPRGLAKTADAFNCASDPKTGKPDDCGRYSSDLYDDDMSAAWTKEYPANGYDLHSDANVGTATSYLPGNQHLYRLWALTSDKYVVRANFSALNLTNVSAESTSTLISGTGYTGDLWLTSGFKPGKSLLSATAIDQNGRGELGQADTALPIYTFFCNNPWPNAKNFPFIDSASNCSVGSGSCINSNFGTYYCRDTGVAKSCVQGNNIGKECTINADCWTNKALAIEGSCQLNTDDDLPSIGEYDALSGKITKGVAMGFSGETCQTLPSSFKLRLGYQSYVDNTNYVWDTNYTSIYRNSGNGWEKIDKGLWQLNGLSANFKPIFGYSVRVGSDPLVNHDYLWSGSEIYVYNGASWQSDASLKAKMQSIGFWPTGGYFWQGHNKVGLFDANGRIVNLDYDANGNFINVSADTTYTAVGFTARPKLFIDYHQGDRGPLMLDVNGNVWQVTSTANRFQQQTIMPAFTASFNPLWGGTNSDGSVFFGLDPKYFTLNYTGNNQWLAAVSATENYKTCDNKLKEFLFAGIKPEGGSDLVKAGDEYNSATNAATATFTKNTIDHSVYTLVNNTTTYDFALPEAGNYYVTLETANHNNANPRASAITVLPLGFNGAYGDCAQGSSLNGRDVYQKVRISIDGKNTSTLTLLATNPDNRQVNRLTAPIFVDAKGIHRVAIEWVNDCYCSTYFGDACQYGDLDSNLQIYSVRLTNANNLSTSDAIGMRVYNNNQHYSAALWYRTKFNPYTQGNLQAINVDGNKAVSEGRTVYVNAPDFGVIDPSGVGQSGTSIYSTIYLMSYNEGVSPTTLNIFKQLTNNWFFNAGGHSAGGLDEAEDVGVCSGGSSVSANTCVTDIDCMKRGAGYCDSTKAKATRDTVRLSDLQDMYLALGSYYNKTRCSNDLTRSCTNNANCFGGGVCGNFYPNLLSGTYISGKTYSVWPSWQQTLGKELGVTLPVDPLNLIYSNNSGTAVKCSDPYNPDTCWSEKDAKMDCRIHASSSFYTYYGTSFGSTNGGTVQPGTAVSIYAKGELFPYNSGNWRPDWNTVTNLRYNPFASYSSQISGQQFCERITNTCGNGRVDTGENCSNCPMDMGCEVGKACQNYSGNWTCGPLRLCGDGQRQVGEECDDHNTSNNDGCNSECLCENGYDCSGGVPVTKCGDGVITGSEQCEQTSNGPSCGNQTYQGQSCCNTETCRLNSWYRTNMSCGDGIKIDQEDCDCGTVGNSIFASRTADGSPPNPFACRVSNQDAAVVSSTVWNLTPLAYQYCLKDTCQGRTAEALYCGDGILTPANEACDKAVNGSKYCSDTCQCAAGATCDGTHTCGYKPGDGVCDSACGETHIANTCDDCAPCHNGEAYTGGTYNNDACCGADCNLVTGKIDPFDTPTFCGAGSSLTCNALCTATSYSTGCGQTHNNADCTPATPAWSCTQQVSTCVHYPDCTNAVTNSVFGPFCGDLTRNGSETTAIGTGYFCGQDLPPTNIQSGWDIHISQVTSPCTLAQTYTSFDDEKSGSRITAKGSTADLATNFRINFNTDPTSDFLFQLSPRRSDGNYYSPIVREGKNFWGTPVNEFTADGSVCAGGGACWFKLVDLNGNDVHRDTLRYGVPYKLQYTDAEMGNGTAGAVWRTVGLNGVSPAEWRANGSDDMIIMLFNNQGNL